MIVIYIRMVAYPQLCLVTKHLLSEWFFLSKLSTAGEYWSCSAENRFVYYLSVLLTAFLATQWHLFFFLLTHPVSLFVVKVTFQGLELVRVFLNFYIINKWEQQNLKISGWQIFFQNYTSFYCFSCLRLGKFSNFQICSLKRAPVTGEAKGARLDVLVIPINFSLKRFYWRSYENSK